MRNGGMLMICLTVNAFKVANNCYQKLPMRVKSFARGKDICEALNFSDSFIKR